MAEPLPRHYLYASILFIFLMVSFIIVISEFDNEYSEFTDREKYVEFNNSVYKLNEIQDEITELESRIRNSEPDPGVFGVLNSLIQSSWQVLKLLSSSFVFMLVAFTDLAAIFSIPAWIANTLLLLLVVLVSFAIWSAIFQRDI